MKDENKSRSRKDATVKPKGKGPAVTAALVNSICDEISRGATMTEICRRPGMPDIQAVNRFINRSSSLRDRLARARATAAEVMADEIAEIADDGRNDYIEREYRDGRIERKLDDEHVRRSQLRIQTRQWLLSKLLPDRFGDRVQAQVSGPGGGPVQVEHSLSASMVSNLARLRERLPASAPSALPASAPVTLQARVRKVEG